MDAQDAFNWFRPTMEKLHLEGFRTGCVDWWRSRWYERCGYGAHLTTEEWHQVRELYFAFFPVWQLYRNAFQGLKTQQLKLF